MSNQSIRDKILSCQSLPTLPAVAVQLLEVTRNPGCPIEEISRIVKSDQGIAAKILKTINSSYYALSTPCGTIDRALALLGMNTVKSLALGFSLVSATKSSEKDTGLDMDAFWKRAIYTAAASRQVALATEAADSDEAFTAGLFQDVGMLAMAKALGSQYTSILAEAGEDHEILTTLEHDALGLDHAQIGADFAQKWGLPHDLSNAIRGHHDPDQRGEGAVLPKIIIVGRLLAAALGDPSQRKYLADAARASQSWFGTTHEETKAWLQQIIEDASTLSAQFDKDLGDEPNLFEIMAEANERLMQHQIETAHEASRLREESLTDGLTGVANRKHFDSELARLWAEANHRGEAIAVLFIDADRFKSVNDTHGHKAGDSVLVELAARASSCVGSRGTVCRYGGEEFAVLLPGLDESEAIREGESVRQAIADAPFDLSQVECDVDRLDVTISVGVASTAGNDLSAEELVQRADQGLYEAKRAGRNRVCVAAVRTHTPEPVAAVQGKASLNVLLIEDDALAAKLVEMLLRKSAEASTTWVSSADGASRHVEAIIAGRQPRPDVIITDLNLPDTRGVEIITTLRGVASLAEVPLLVVSADSQQSVRDRCLAAGATDFVGKDEVARNISGWIRRVVALRTCAADAA